MPESHLLILALGPVQEFIVQARRTQDWWMGSWLLAHLSRKAMVAIEDAGGRWIVPHEVPPEDKSDAPNKFTACFELSSDDTAVRAEQAACAVRKEWRRIAGAVRDRFFDDVSEPLWDGQVDNFLEVYWAVVPGDGDRASRRAANRALDARKHLRNFGPATEEGEKDTLSGMRAALHEQGRGSRAEVRKYWADLAVSKFSSGLRVLPEGRERLDAIGAIKRAAVAAGAIDPKRPQFPSTSSVAAASFKAQLFRGRANGSLWKKVEDHLSFLREIGIPDEAGADSLPRLKKLAGSDANSPLLTFDGDLFYFETFTEKRLKETYPLCVATDFDYPLDSLRELYATTRTLPISRPARYFAALAMDGDGMGKAFDESDDPKAVSEALARFAREDAQRVIEVEHKGRLVYAGGDDILALLPLEDALPAAQALCTAFAAAVKGLPHPPTTSAGIAIGHHMQPLSATLEAMQAAERDAKLHYGRNAVCVHLLKRSGERVRVGTHWSYGKGFQPIPLLLEFVEMLRADILSRKFPTTVAATASGLAAVPGAQSLELCRLALKRHQGSKFEAEAHTAKVRSAAESLAAWAGSRYQDDELPLGIEEVSRWLLLARFIVAGGEE